MTWEGDTLQTGIGNSLCLILVPCHTHTEEALGVLLLYLCEVFILTSVNHLLNYNGSTYLGIVHV